MMHLPPKRLRRKRKMRYPGCRKEDVTLATNKNRIALFLAHEVSKSYNAYVKEIAEKLGLKNAYRALLFELSADEGCTQLALVRKTGLKAPTVSITLRQMERDGLVSRQTDEHDLRKTHVYMTEAGKTLVSSVKEKMAEAEDIILKNIDLGDKEILVDALQKVRDNLILLHRRNDNLN